MSKVTFPVTITGINITERNVTPPRFRAPVDKAGITIQQTNLIDQEGKNIVIPVGAWLNGAAKVGSLDSVSVGTTIEVSISAKPKGDGTFWYNFNYYPETAKAPTLATTNPNIKYVTEEVFLAEISRLDDKINELNF